jgi:DNA invertase Pin-like site-specific DNA recombinase/CYTH domain-containing protein
MSKLAIPYIRMSTKEQLKGHSLSRQTDYINEYAKINDLTVDWTTNYIDIGRSAFKGKNLLGEAGLGRFLGAVQAGVIKEGSILLIESLDRLSRQEVKTALAMLLQILEYGIEIHTIGGSETAVYTKKSDEKDIIIAVILLGRANNESVIKQERLNKSWEKKRKIAESEKIPITSRIPAWLRIFNGKFEIIKHREEILLRIIDMKLSGYGADKISYILNSEDIETWGEGKRKGKQWYPSYIKKIIKSEALIGTYFATSVVNDKRVIVSEIKDYYPKIISKDLYGRLNIKKTKNIGRKSAYFSNLFSGVAVCKICGSTMTMINKGKPPKGFKYLVCSSAKSGKGCVYNAAPYLDLEYNILTHIDSLDVRGIVEPENNNELMEEIKENELQISNIGRQLDKIKKSIDNYLIETESEIIPSGLIRRESSLDNELVSFKKQKNELIVKLNSKNISRNNLDFDIKKISGEDFILRSQVNNEMKLILEKIEFQVHGSYKVVEVDIYFIGGYRSVLLIDKKFKENNINKVLTIPVYNKKITPKTLNMRDNMNIFRSDDGAFLDFKKHIIERLVD